MCILWQINHVMSSFIAFEGLGFIETESNGCERGALTVITGFIKKMYGARKQKLERTYKSLKRAAL